VNVIDLYTGIGGFAYSVKQVWDEPKFLHFVENDRYCIELLKLRYPGVPIHEEVKTFKARKYRGTVDLLTAGFPCQPFSQSGKRKGSADDRYLWPEAFKVIKDARPRWVILENVPGITTLASGVVFDEICFDLENNDYEIAPLIIPASAVNADHRRYRLWIVANLEVERTGHMAVEWQPEEKDSDSDRSDQNDGNRNGERMETGMGGGMGSIPGIRGDTERKPPEPDSEDGIESNGRGREGNDGRQAGKKYKNGHTRDPRWSESSERWDGDWREVALELCDVRMDDGLPAEIHGLKLTRAGHRKERIKALGNSIVPQVVIPILKTIKEIDTCQSQR